MDYFLTDNHLTSDPDDQTAIPANVRSFNDEQIIERITARGTTLTRPDLQAATTAYRDEIGYIVEEGNAVNTGLINATPSITGKFKNTSDNFDRARHRMHYNVSFSQTIQAKADKVKMNRIQAMNTGPIIIGIKDSVSGLTDGTLTVGGVLDIYGIRLKVFTESADNGVYFVAVDGTEYKAVTLVENKPSRLIVMLPSLPSGTYVLEVRTHFINSNKPGKQLRKIQFAKPLIV